MILLKNLFRKQVQSQLVRQVKSAIFKQCQYEGVRINKQMYLHLHQQFSSNNKNNQNQQGKINNNNNNNNKNKTIESNANSNNANNNNSTQPASNNNTSSNKINSKSSSPQPNNPPQQQPLTQQQQNLIKSHQPDQIFNLFMNLQAKHNLQKDLIIAKKVYQKSTKQLRASILFQDLLKTQIQIPIYDTKGKPFMHMWFKNLFNLAFFAMTIWFLKSLSNSDPKNKVLLERTTSGKIIQYVMYGFATWFLLSGLYRYIKFQRRFVQKMIYDTKSQMFIVTKRKLFGSRYENEISRFKIVYTENQFLNKKGTNYFNIQTKQQYSIPYKEYWIKQDLFSHLIAQRIKI